VVGVWKPDLHPRDEYGRFRLSGQSGVWDSLAGRVETQAHARTIADYHAAGRELGRFPNITDPAARPALERSRAAKRALPEAFFAGGMPHDDGFWRDRHNRATNAFGELLPPMLVAGAVRVGDHPQGRGINERGTRNASPQANGVWHRPGEYWPGRVPILRNDYGHPMGQLMPEPSASRQHRTHHGAFARGEIKASERLQGAYGKEVRRRGREVPTTSPEVHGAYQNDPRNPVGRMRTVPGHRRRQRRTTWIQRINAQMEGR
jgi:hypothetical protein